MKKPPLWPKSLEGLRDLIMPPGPPIFLVAIIAFLVAMLATIYMQSIV